MSTARHMTRMPLCVGHQKGNDIEVRDLRPRDITDAATDRERYRAIMRLVSSYGAAQRKIGRLDERCAPATDYTEANQRADLAHRRVCFAVIWALDESGRGAEADPPHPASGPEESVAARKITGAGR